MDSGRAEMRAEGATKMHDALAEVSEGDEFTRVQTAIAGYGDLAAAPPVWRGPAAIMLNYGCILALGVVGVFVLILLHMAVLDIFYPQAVGLWRYDGGGWSLSYEVQAGAEEVLGAWFIPAILTTCAATSALLYALWRFAVAPTGAVSRWMKE